MDPVAPLGSAALLIGHPHEIQQNLVRDVSVVRLVAFQPLPEGTLSVSAPHVGHNLNPRRADQEASSQVRQPIRTKTVDGVIQQDSGAIQLCR